MWAHAGSSLAGGVIGVGCSFALVERPDAALMVTCAALGAVVVTAAWRVMRP